MHGSDEYQVNFLKEHGNFAKKSQNGCHLNPKFLIAIRLTDKSFRKNGYFSIFLRDSQKVVKIARIAKFGHQGVPYGTPKVQIC